MKSLSVYLFLISSLILAGCVQDQADLASDALPQILPSLEDHIRVLPDGEDDNSRARLQVERINRKLNRINAPVRLHKMEYLTGPESDKQGQEVFFNNRGNKQLASDWLPFDDRRPCSSFTDGLCYIIEQVDVCQDVSPTAMTGAIQSAMSTWERVRCSDLTLPRISDLGLDWGYVQYLLGFGGLPAWLADLTHAGFLPGEFFDLVASGGSSFILGVTFTFVWLDDDGNRSSEVAFREIYYNDAYNWGVGSHIDIETVALHEAGHGLSQGHFGRLSQTVNGKFHFSPRAVMNAGYTGIQTDIEKTDNAGHCSLWGNWPNN